MTTTAPVFVDVDRDAIDALEFEELLELVAGHARTSMGRERVLAARPVAALDAVGATIETVREVAGFRVRHGRIVAGATPDPRPALERLAVEGARVDARPLRDLAEVVVAAVRVRERIAEAAGEDDTPVPRLEAIARAIPDLEPVARIVLEGVEADGTVSERASAELRRLRREIATVGHRLRTKLEALVRDPARATTIRDAFVTQRNGRYVVPVRADAHGKVGGIVHGGSASGATLFVEPLDAVELNNDLVRLAEREREEIDRVLREWSERFRARLDDAGRAVDAVAELDAFQARADYGDTASGVLPTLVEGGPIRLVAVRHPLLDRRLAERGGTCVPIDLRVEPYDRVLLVSGPNTGGKTVALKTLGLAVLMAHCGIPVPAEVAELPRFGQLRADIGDHQSLEADLSTFSAHLGNARRFLGEIAPPALVLFDEIGTGTDPAEGAALAQATLEALARPGVTVAASTHHGALKAWGFADERVVSAGMELDRTTLAPTYRVLDGTAGESAGLEIAQRLGLPAALVARARALLGEDRGRLERSLAGLRDRMDALERERGELREARGAAERERAAARAEIDAEVAEIRDRAQRELARALDEFERDGRAELRGIADRAERERRKLEHRAAARRMDARAKRVRGRVLERAKDEEVVPEDWKPTVGAPVHVRSLDRAGKVVEIRGAKTDVQCGAIRMTVATVDLAPSSSGEIASPAARPQRPDRVVDDLRSGVEAELKLIGRIVDDALPELERFLDRAARAGMGEVRIVHGHGTGRLRRALRRHLDRHPLVRSHRPGGRGEGGDGATVVTLG